MIYIVFFFSSNATFAQLNGSFLNETQLGNIPRREPSNLISNYTRLSLNYDYKNISFRSMSEVFMSQNDNTSYISPSQISFQYKSKHLELKLGNAYETIGRGNILRSYEIPGSILEDKIFRSRSYFYKDLLGGSLKYSTGNFSVKLLGGKPLDNLIPPTESISKRRPEIVFALNPEYKYKQAKFGTGLMSYSNAVDKGKLYLTNYASYNFGKNSVYFELSNQLKTSNSYAFYGGFNFTSGDFGGAIEIKDYKNFLIGTGINQPPALVREHIYRVLNRSTHVLLPENERGIQAEFFYSKDKHLITLNQTLAQNDFGKKFLFSETFLEYQYNAENGNTFKAFADYTQDDFKSEQNRISFGSQQDFSIKNKKIKAEFEFQTFTRQGERVTNQVYGITVFPLNNLTFSPILEITNDPFLTDNTKYFLGAYSRYVIKSKYTIQAFIGERRGGPACNAGICYEVLDFKGAELKGVIRF
ncbi:MAG: hypothetical protein U5N85_03320 [Arcicella sp.]|nr:hypothetical protein [Arcicella sp.]